MKTKVLSLSIVAIMLLGVLAAAASVNVGNQGGSSSSPTGSSSTTILVDDDFVDDPPNHKWDTIQEGVNDAISGDTVYVYAGTYNENVLVDVRIDLIGEDMDTTEIDAGGSGDVIHVGADRVNITGFKVTGSGSADRGAGIKLNGVQNCSITGNNATDNYWGGIYLDNSHGNIITDNIAMDNSHSGIYLDNSHENIIIGNLGSDTVYDGNVYSSIYLDYSNENIITGNNASNNFYYGIWLEYSNRNIITGNNASNNVYGILLFDSDENSIIDNNVSDNSNGIFLLECEGNSITDNIATINFDYGIWLSDSDGNSIADNDASDNKKYGINIGYSNDNTITSNTVTNNELHGFKFFDSEENSITDNDVSNNVYSGIYLDHSDTNSITGNSLSDNLYGIWLDRSNGVSIIGNTASNNRYGIWPHYSEGNIITDNTASNNVYYGIYLDDSNANSVTGNTASNNVYTGIYLDNAALNNITDNTISSNSQSGITLSVSINNVIYHNNIIDNTIQAEDGSPEDNDWYDPILLEGNYWSDYAGLDDGSGTGKHGIAKDGIGDTFIPHPASNYDFYPFINENGWIATENQPPVADAGLDQSINEGETAYFDSTGSYDPDPRIDMVFVVDTSPSMPDEWSILSTTLPIIEQDLMDEGYDLQFTVLGLDHGNTYDTAVMDGWLDYGIRIQPDSSRLTECLRNTLISNPHGHNVNTANPSPCYADPSLTCDSHSTHVSEGWAQGAAYVAVHHSWRPGAIRIVTPIGDSAPWHQTRDGVSGVYANGEPNVYSEDWDTINGTAQIANENEVYMFPMYDEACDPDGAGSPGTGPIQDLFISLGDQTGGTAYQIDDDDGFIDAVIDLIEGLDKLTYSWDFDAEVDLDGDGNFTNDDEAQGPYADHQYGDDGDGTDDIYTVTLAVTDKGGLTATDSCIVTVLNIDPTATIESTVMNIEISLRVAGSKWSNVGLTLYEDKNRIGYIEVERWPGSPNNNPSYVGTAFPTTLDMTKTYKAVVTYDPYPDSGDEIRGDQPNNGKDKQNNAGNPVWIIIRFDDGSEERIHHIFNTQQSMKRNSAHSKHVEPWEVEFSSYLLGHPFTVRSISADPGSDDEQFTFTYGAQTVIKTYYNNVPVDTPDPYPSPELNPVDIIDTTILIYEGPGTLTLNVKDDDNIRITTTGSSTSISIG
jgi:parallel beta-helix repeat protein